MAESFFFTSVTTSRLVVVREGEAESVSLFGTGEVVKSCPYVDPPHSFTKKYRHLVQEFAQPYCYTVESIDDSQLLADLMGGSGMQPSLALIDTEKPA